MVKIIFFLFGLMIGQLSMADDGAREASPFLPLWNGRKCLRWGDVLVEREAVGRLKWARLCYPDYEAYYRYADRHHTPDGMRRKLYPIFAEIHDGEVTNPLKYYAPIEESDECDLQESYQLVGLCESHPEQ